MKIARARVRGLAGRKRPRVIGERGNCGGRPFGGTESGNGKTAFRYREEGFGLFFPIFWIRTA